MRQSPQPDQEPTQSQESPPPKASAGDAIHSICQSAPDQRKCEEFVERLDEAANNIDPRQT